MGRVPFKRGNTASGNRHTYLFKTSSDISCITFILYPWYGAHTFNTAHPPTLSPLPIPKKQAIYRVTVTVTVTVTCTHPSILHPIPPKLIIKKIYIYLTSPTPDAPL